MKIVREHINEKFTEGDTDPIKDLNYMGNIKERRYY